MSTLTLRAAGARDLISHLPYRFGFHPARSVVLVALGGSGHRMTVGLVARSDTAAFLDPDRGLTHARAVAAHLVAEGAVAVFTVVYADEPLRAVRTGPGTAALRAVLERALPGRVRAEWMWAVAADGYGHLMACRCCPPEGAPLAELESTSLSADLVLAGYSAAPSREDLALTRTADASARAAAAAGAQEEAARVPAPGAPGRRAWRRAGAALWERSLSMPPPPPTLGRLLVLLGDPVLRDAVLTAAINPQPVTRLLGDREVLAAFAAAPAPRPPEPGRSAGLARAVAAHAPEGQAAPALALAAFLAWWDLDGARADVLAAQALTEEPGHRLAELVQAALDAGLPPAWYDRARRGP